MSVFIQKQTWHSLVRYIIMDENSSVQLDLYNEGVKTNFGGTAYIFALWVDEPHRLKGCATALLNFAEGLAKAEGHKSVHMEWLEIDTPREVLEWYFRRGYEEREFGDGYSLLEKKL